MWVVLTKKCQKSENTLNCILRSVCIYIEAIGPRADSLKKQLKKTLNSGRWLMFSGSHPEDILKTSGRGRLDIGRMRIRCPSNPERIRPESFRRTWKLFQMSSGPQRSPTGALTDIIGAVPEFFEFFFQNQGLVFGCYPIHIRYTSGATLILSVGGLLRVR